MTLVELHLGWCDGQFTCLFLVFRKSSSSSLTDETDGLANDHDDTASIATLPPPVFLIGAMKSGTTALADALYHHPFIHKPHIIDQEPEWFSKEVHFFNVNTSYSQGRLHYERHFDRYLPPGHVSLDATPGYLYEPFVAERVHRMYGKDIKILVILRDPVARALSHWR